MGHEHDTKQKEQKEANRQLQCGHKHSMEQFTFCRGLEIQEAMMQKINPLGLPYCAFLLTPSSFLLAPSPPGIIYKICLEGFAQDDPMCQRTNTIYTTSQHDPDMMVPQKQKSNDPPEIVRKQRESDQQHKHDVQKFWQFLLQQYDASQPLWYGLVDFLPILHDHMFLKCIADGGFGQIYEAVHLKTGEARIVKVVHRHSRKDCLAAEMEALMLAGVPEHKNIIRQFGWAVSVDYINIFLEHGGSNTLAQVQKRELHQRFTISQAMHLFYDMLQALLHLHRCGVCHLDIKPENVMWGDDHVLRLVDFGSAAYIEDFVGNPCVTFPYAAPELLDMKFTGSKCRGDYADCFSLGVLLFNLAFGLSAFSEHLGWENKPTKDLANYLGMRAAEMREMLHRRKALCETMISCSDPCASTRARYQDFLLPPLLGLLHPEPCLRMALPSVHVLIRKYFKTESGSSKRIVNKSLHAVHCCSQDLSI